MLAHVKSVMDLIYHIAEVLTIGEGDAALEIKDELGRLGAMPSPQNCPLTVVSLTLEGRLALSVDPKKSCVSKLRGLSSALSVQKTQGDISVEL
ncbi:hypothetical protein AVEN_164895-1 [Araneus ventricosus]|uniref:Uncharacterized protein n=1 Tax=Araneus ventricosus TaxID=182803 RepID=A0A4Y2DT72_ARAVE|nr:hypothetical protein AVEN_164895-1 [Araneus ventricosus]